MKLKLAFLFFLVFITLIELPAQTDTSRTRSDTGRGRQPNRTDTGARRQQDTSLNGNRVRLDTNNRNTRTDSLTTPRPSRSIVDSPRRQAPRTTPTPPTPPVSRPIIDTIPVVTDTIPKDTVVVATPVFIDTTNYSQYFRHPHLAFDQPAVFMLMKERLPDSKDRVFYLIIGLLFFMAVIRLLFPKYFHGTFRLFFQSSFRQKQTREQLQQQTLGSVLLNLLFFFSTATYVTLVLEYSGMMIFPFWQLLFYSCLALLFMYVGKFLFLKFAGWVFNVQEGAETYIFIVFLINKIIGVMLIPFNLVIAFADPTLAQSAITASLILLALLFIYRYFVSLSSFRRDLHITPFHFFLYLCGVEIVPLLILGKALFNYIDVRF